jgi:hypothetical protein
MLAAWLLAANALASTPNTVAARVAVVGNSDGRGVVLGAEGEHFFGPVVTAGGYLEGTIATAYRASCNDGTTCFFDYAATGALLGLHAVPLRSIDLYLRGALGLARIGPSVGDTQLRDHALLAAHVRGQLGIDYRFGAVVFGPTAALAAFSARNPTALDLGLRMGACW